MVRQLQSALVEGKKDRQLVLRLPAALLAAVEKHRLELEAARPFERITMAGAVRDLLALALTIKAKRRK
jgi:hypothetical protein